MIKVNCAKCGNELDIPGGIAFSPPDGIYTEKFHLCEACWKLFLKWLFIPNAPDQARVLPSPEVHYSPFPHNPAHPVGTCSECGGEMIFNVPRLGPDGGYVHKATGRCLCNDTPNVPDQARVLPSLEVG